MIKHPVMHECLLIPFFVALACCQVIDDFSTDQIQAGNSGTDTSGTNYFGDLRTIIQTDDANTECGVRNSSFIIESLSGTFSGAFFNVTSRGEVMKRICFFLIDAWKGACSVFYDSPPSNAANNLCGTSFMR